MQDRKEPLHPVPPLKEILMRLSVLVLSPFSDGRPTARHARSEPASALLARD